MHGYITYHNIHISLLCTGVCRFVVFQIQSLPIRDCVHLMNLKQVLQKKFTENHSQLKFIPILKGKY